MSIHPEEILARVKAAVAASNIRRPKAAFRPPTPDDFAPDVQILCFDQALANCGWALLNTEETISVALSGTIRRPLLNGEKGFEATFARSVSLSRAISQLLIELYGQFESTVLELPAVQGYRTESSLIAAVTICVELDRMGLAQPHFISRQAAAAHLVNDRHAPKAVTSQFVNAMVTTHPRANGQWTEHVRDSVLVGLEHLYLEES